MTWRLCHWRWKNCGQCRTHDWAVFVLFNAQNFIKVNWLWTVNCYLTWDIIINGDPIKLEYKKEIWGGWDTLKRRVKACERRRVPILALGSITRRHFSWLAANARRWYQLATWWTMTCISCASMTWPHTLHARLLEMRDESRESG